MNGAEMQDTDHVIEVATLRDLEGILALQARNQISEGGTLSGSIPASRVAEMMSTMPLIVSRRNGEIVGYLMTSTRALNADIPIIRAMLDAYPGAADAYIYGPVCVDVSARGKRLAQAMFGKLCAVMPNREGILFIRQDNEPSLAAHRRMGMTEAGVFSFGGHDHTAFSFVG